MLRRIFGQALEVGGAGKSLFFESGVGRFGFSGRRGFFFVLDNFLGRWGRSRAGLLGDGSLVVGCDDSLDFSLHLGVRSTSLKQKKLKKVFVFLFFRFSIPPIFVCKNNLFSSPLPLFFPCTVRVNFFGIFSLPFFLSQCGGVKGGKGKNNYTILRGLCKFQEL